MEEMNTDEQKRVARDRLREIQEAKQCRETENARATCNRITRYGGHRMLRRREVELLTGLSRSTLYAWISDGSFPKPVKLGKRAVGWPEDVIYDWLHNRRDAA